MFPAETCGLIMRMSHRCFLYNMFFDEYYGVFGAASTRSVSSTDGQNTASTGSIRIQGPKRHCEYRQYPQHQTPKYLKVQVVFRVQHPDVLRVLGVRALSDPANTVSTRSTSSISPRNDLSSLTTTGSIREGFQRRHRQHNRQYHYKANKCFGPRML